jgi:hypothetical protein
MRSIHPFYTAATLLLIILVSACTSATTLVPSPAPTIATPPTTTSTPEPTPVPTIDFERQLEEFDPANFDDPTLIDNPWLPRKPGMQYIYEGITEEGGESIPHRVITTVTDLTKMIGGIPTVVVWDQDFSAGYLVETELAFFAQDNDGNVWRMGEYPEVYELGKLIETPAWIHGLKGARAGIMMKAEPQLGIPSYSQGWGPAVNFTDRGQVDQLGQETCIPLGCYEDVLVIAEFSKMEIDAVQLKYYAPEVGNVQVGWRGADATKETLELVDFIQLSPQEIAEVRPRAMELEERAYKNSKEVYAQTQPVEYLAVEEPTAVATTASMAPEKIYEDFDPANFENPTTIDNPWLPLAPGTHWVYEGFTVEEEEEIPHRIEFTATDLTKNIEGIQTVAVLILDFSNDQLVEKEIAFYAQDVDGNVWYLGEYPEEYEDGEFIDAPTWISGIEDAKAGIKMMADPQLGTPGYFQGWAPTIDWSDYGQVDQIGQQTCVPVDCYEDVLVIAESSLQETDAFHLKYYAREVGNVRVGWKGADATQEELELVEYLVLSPETLAEIRTMALDLEAHAYQVSPEVYGQTPPINSP